MKKIKDFGLQYSTNYLILKVLVGLFLTILSFNGIEAQIGDPNYFWDFSKVTNLDGKDYVFEQSTQDEKLAFGFLPPRTQTCTGNASQMTYPQQGAEGVFFKARTDSMRLENANNLGLVLSLQSQKQIQGNKYQLAVWYKVNPFNWCFLRNVLRLVRYDYYTGHFIEHGANCYVTYLYTHPDGYNVYNYETKFHWYPYAYYKPDNVNSGLYYWGSTNVTVQEGWYLHSISVDASSGVRTSVTIRARGPGGYYDNYVYSATNYVVSESYWPTQKADLYIGAWCNPRPGTGYFTDGMIFTMGRMYMWKNAANLNDHRAFDRFFFRNSGSISPDTKTIVMPQCKGRINCTSCIVDYPFPDTTVPNTPLTCITENASNKTIYWAFYDFDHPSNNQTNQFVLDQSGNGYHLMKRPTDLIGPDEIFRIYGQGFLFYNGAWIHTVQNVPLDRLNQFTIEVWCRKVYDGSKQEKQNPPGLTTGAPLIIFDPKSSKVIYGFTISDVMNQTWFNFRRGQESSTFMRLDGILQNDTWHYFALSFSWYLIYPRWWQIDGDYYYYIIRHQINDLVRYDYRAYVDQSDQNSIPPTSYMQVGVNDKTMIYKSLKILNGETKGKCISMCKEREYGDDCKKCHNACGHCTGPNSTNCVYCHRNMTESKFYYSEKFGNCSCQPQTFYNESSGSCDNCSASCVDCFGSNYTECFTCQIDQVYFPNTTCAPNCSHPLVKNGTNNTFFQVNETFYGDKTNLCRRCHPFCDHCNGTTFTNCINCSDGFFLQQDNITCLDDCPNGQYQDIETKTCKSCHADCATCYGPNATNCLLCKDPTKKQMDGSCLTNCTGAYYPDKNNVCQKCSPECTACTDFGRDQCTQCSSGSYLRWMTTFCADSCPSGTYPNQESNSCLQCHYSCANCTTGAPNGCIVCAPGMGYLYSSGSCVTTCQPGEFIQDNQCKTCDSKCFSCFGPKDTECISCNENKLTGLGYYFFNNSCLDQCPKGYYPDNLRRICVRCPSTCASCISSTFCTECIVGPYQLNNGECTFFTCMETQYRGISPRLACFECDKSCKTCQGFSKFDCLTCSAKSFFNAQQCLSCNEQPGMMNPLDESIVGCQEICGDGFNYGYYQCDDGNLINGDGCSSQCTVELGFNCTLGSKFSSSVCMDSQNPTPKISLVGADNTIYISFDEEVYLKGTLDTKTLEITVSGPQTSYSFDWRLGDSYKTSSAVQMIGIVMNFYSSIKGNQKETVTVKFLDDSIYQDATGNGLIVVPLQSYLNKYDYIDPATKAQLDSASDTSIMATYGVVAINLVISQLFGGSIAAMWTMVNTLQLLSLLPLCNINYPPIVVMVLQKMLSSHGESTAIPNIFYSQIVDRPGSKVKIERALNNKFQSYGWPISNFLYLSGRKILLWTMLIFIYPFVWYMKKNYSDKHKLCQKWISIEQKFRYTLLLRGVIMSYVSMYLAFLLGIFKMDLTTMENTISAFTAIAFGIMLTFLPVHLMNILQRNYEKIETEKFMLQYSTIVKEVDLSHPIRYMFYPVFLLRRALFAIELVIFADTPTQQIIAMSITAFVMIIYVCVIKPQKEKVMIVLTAVSEALLLALHLYSFVFLDPDMPDEQANSYGFLMLAIIGIYILSNWVIIIKITIGQLKQKWAERKTKKIDQKKKEQEDQEYKKWKKKRTIKQQMLKERARSQAVYGITQQDNNSIMISRASNFNQETNSPLKRGVKSRMNERSHSQLFNQPDDLMRLNQIGNLHHPNATSLSPQDNNASSPDIRTLINLQGAQVFTINEMIDHPTNTAENDNNNYLMDDTHNIFYAQSPPSKLRKIIQMQSDANINQFSNFQNDQGNPNTNFEQDGNKIFKQVMCNLKYYRQNLLVGQNRYKSSFQTQSEFTKLDRDNTKDLNGLSFHKDQQLKSFNSTKDQRREAERPKSSPSEELDADQMLEKYLNQ